MHLLIGLRGQPELAEAFVTEIQTHYLTYNKSLNDLALPQNQKPNIQIGVQPLQLYSINFPKEHLDNILRALGGSNFNVSDKRRFIKIIHYLLKIARKIFGLKDVPDKWEKEGWVIKKSSYVDVKYLALKDDEHGKLEFL